MKIEKIAQTAKAWDEEISRVLDLKELDVSNIRRLLKDTYMILKTYSGEQEVPKEICRLLLSVDEFLYFASIMEGKEVKIDFYHYQSISNIVSAMKKGFFDGNFEKEFEDLITDYLIVKNTN